MTERAFTGACSCGRVQFRMDAAPITTHCCHCRSCQKHSGSAFGTCAMLESEHLTMLQGKPEQYQGADGHTAVRCSDCCAVLWTYHRHFGAAIAFVRVGVLAEGERLVPEAHYFTRSKHPWIVLPSDVPAFVEMGYPEKPEAAARIESVLAAAVP